MPQPTPSAPIVIRKQRDTDSRTCFIYTASDAANEWIAKHAPNYGSLRQLGMERADIPGVAKEYAFAVSHCYDMDEVIAHLTRDFDPYADARYEAWMHDLSGNIYVVRVGDNLFEATSRVDKEDAARILLQKHPFEVNAMQSDHMAIYPGEYVLYAKVVNGQLEIHTP